MAKFTKLEKELLDKFLDELEDHQSNAGCNDYTLPNTVEGRRIRDKSVRLSMDKKDADEWLAGEDGEEAHIYTMDYFVLRYLRNKLEKLL